MAEEEKTSTQNYRFAAPLSSAAPAKVSSFQPGGQAQPDKDDAEQKDTHVYDPSSANIIRFGRMQYAIGLFWQPLQDVDDPIPEIRETMESEQDASLYAIHYGRAPQYGIGSVKKGHKDGLVVGAIAVLDSLSEQSSFVAVFKVDIGWWFLVVRNDLILPEEDVLYRTEQEARDAFDAMMAVPDWGYKIAPASWEIDDAEEMDLEKLLKEGQQVRLLSLGAMRGMKVLLIIASLITILAIGIVYLFYSFVDKEKTEAPKIEPIVPTASYQTQEPTRQEEKPWEKLVAVPTFLSRCWSDAYQLKSMIVPGWTLNQIVCTPTEIQTGWTKTGRKASRVAWIETAIRDQYKLRGETQINETGTSAIIKFTFDDLPVKGSEPELTLQKLRRELVDISQALSLPINMSVEEITVELPKPPEEADKKNDSKEYVKVYRYLAFSFTSSMDPPAWESFFDKFSGLEVTKIEYNPNSKSALTNNWKYEGRIYEPDKEK